MTPGEENLDTYPIATSGNVAEQVPIIDVANVVIDASSSAAKNSVEEIAAACRDWGFFQVVNHGISARLIADTWEQTRAFFGQPRKVKEQLLRTRENPWGYYNNELTKNQRDKKEVFDFTTEGLDPIYGAENRWPQLAPDFQATLGAYRDACANLGLSLLDAFCVGLDLPTDFMRADFANHHTGFMRLNYYPVNDPLCNSQVAHLPTADLGVHHHSDAGALTVLLQDDVGGLQVFKDGYWHNVAPIDGAMVINTGDMMQVWSNDWYQAPIHRVLAMDASDRFSIPFFFNPAATAIVEPLPTVVNAARPARYQPISWSEYRGQRTDGDFADYGPEIQISQYKNMGS